MRPEHASDLFVWMRDPALYEYLSQSAPPDVAALAAIVRRWTSGAPDRRERWWNWSARLADVTGEPIVGQVQLTFSHVGEVFAAWVFAPNARGRGLATEATRAALALAATFDRGGTTTVAAAIDASNVASIRLAERLGMVCLSDRSESELRFERPLAAFDDAAAPGDGGVTLRPATAGDRATLRAFVRAMWLDMGTPPERFYDDWERRFDAGFARLTAHSELRAVVADCDGRAVGAASVHLYESVSPPLLRRRVAYVWGLYVLPAYRGRGIARTLMEECLAAAREMDCTRVVIHAAKAGRRIYTRLGFRASNEMLLELD